MSASSATEYEIYLRTRELLALQKRPEECASHDEPLFQIVHQSAELWMKVIDHEMRLAARLIDEEAPTRAQSALRRVHLIQRLLLDGLELLYTMAPTEYMRIREGLGRGSGQESPGFRRMMAIPAEVWPIFDRLLVRRGLSLRQIYEQPVAHAELFGLAEALLEYDLRLQEWRNRHILLVYRTIGVGTPSLKGKHSELLERGLRTQFFPKLWAVRDEIFASWSEAHPYGATSSLSQR